MGHGKRKRPRTLPGTVVTAILLRMGGKRRGQTGSHLKIAVPLSDPSKPPVHWAITTVVNDSKDVPPKTLASIVRALQHRSDEFWDAYFGIEPAPSAGAPVPTSDTP